MSETSKRLQALFTLRGDTLDKVRRETSVEDFLLFELGGATFALTARQVEEVISWRTPLPLPRADPRVMGVIQDRGRIIVILANDAGDANAKPARIVVCRTPRGYLGLPAARTRCVDRVKVYGDLASKSVVDTSEGVVTFLDSTRLAAVSE